MVALESLSEGEARLFDSCIECLIHLANISAKDIEAKDIWSHIQINGTIGPINVEIGFKWW